MINNNCNVLSCSPQVEIENYTRGYLLCDNLVEANENVAKKLQDITNTEEAAEFLEEYKWKLYPSVPCESTPQSFYDSRYSNQSGFRCFQNDTSALFRDMPCRDEPTCKCIEPLEAEKLISEIASSLVPLFFVYGILALVGNFCVIFGKIMHMRQRNVKRSKEISIFNVLILNLAAADFLMGIVSILSGVVSLGITGPNIIAGVDYCNAFGVLGFISNQVSITILVVISFFRLYSVVSPYKRIHVKVAVGLMIANWIIWVILACLPLFEILNTTGVVIMEGDDVLHIPFASTSKLIATIIDNTNITSTSKMILDVINHFKTPDVMISALQTLGILDQTGANWRKMSFYKRYSSSCFTIMSLIGSGKSSSGVLFISLFVYIAICSVCIAVSYGVIFKHTIGNQGSRYWPKRFSTRHSVNVDPHREAENKKLHRTIFLIVISNFLFWVPTAVGAFLYYEMCLTDTATNHNESFYYFLALFFMCFMPINSVMNPLIYSKHTWVKLLNDLKRRKSRMPRHVFKKSQEVFL